MRKRMTALVAILLSVIMICPFFAEIIGSAAAVTLEEALSIAAPEMYGMYTAATANNLRDCVDRAEKDGAGKNDATAIINAVNSLVPLENHTRRELIGFGKITAEDISSMKYINGTASVSDGYITLSGSDSLCYSNAARKGIIGASPFGMATEDCDGFVLKITSDADAVLDLQIGRRGSEQDCLFVIGDIFISAGERYYLFPFNRFGNIPLDGTLNFISLSFTGASVVSFGDLHAALDTAEDVGGNNEYTETLLTAPVFDSEKYYKLVQKGTDLALTMLVNQPRGTDPVVFEQKDDDDIGQLWQICSDPVYSSHYRLVNKLTGDTIEPDNTGLAITPAVPSLNKSSQEWSISYMKAKGFSLFISYTGRLSYLSTRVRFTGLSVAAKHFDIYAVEGESWDLAWSDEFNGQELDRSVWQVENAKNRPSDTEPMYNRDSPSNLYLNDGNLVIKTKVEEYMGYHATSAYLDTEEKLIFGYGRFEMRAKLPEGNKLWPAFWMMGEKANWARCGEIDALEMVCGGENDNRAIATAHFSDEKGEHAEEGGLNRGCLFDRNKLSENYHLYAIEWDANQIRWYFDDILYLSVNTDTDEKRVAFQNNPIFIILGTGMEGPGQNRLPEGVPDESFFIIDYIRYYKEAKSAKPSDNIPYKYTSYTPDNYKQYYSVSLDSSYSTANDSFYFSNVDNKTYIYNMKDFSLKKSVAVSGGGWTMSSAISGDGNTVIEGRQIGLLRVRLDTYNTQYADKVYCENPALALNFDGSLCYAGGESNRPEGIEYCKYLHIFETDTLTEVATEYTGSWIDSITVANNGNYAFGCYDGTVRIRTPENEKIGSFTLNGRVVSLAFSDDGKLLFAADALGNIIKYDMSSSSAVPFAQINDEPYEIKVSKDGKILLVACGDSCARAFSTENGRLIYRVGLGNTAVTSLDFSLDGRMFNITTTDGNIGIFRTEDGLPLAKLSNAEHPKCWYVTAGFSSDGSGITAMQHGIGSFKSAVVYWKLPDNLLEEKADFSSLENLDYYNQTEYTKESYAPYADAFEKASKIHANRYSSQQQIDNALLELNEAVSNLVNVPDVMKGDFDEDNEITVADALAALRIAAKLVAEDDTSIAIGDVDGDLHVTVADALAILRVAAKLTENL